MIGGRSQERRIMKPKGVNKVVIAAVRDFDKGIEFYSKLLGATFDDVSATGEPFGLKVAFSWDAGMEICAPIPGRDSYVEAFIEEHGEGLMSVIFAFDDVDEALGRAEEMGISVTHLIEYDQDEIRQHYEDRFKKYKEVVLNAADCYGAGVILGQIELK